MSCFFQDDLSKKLAKLLPALWAISTAALLQPSTSHGQAVPQALQGADWISGPAVSGLGNVAELKIPQGYSFTEAKGARDYLAAKGSPIPDGLVGILVPDAGDWRIILKYSEPGYLKEVTAADLDASALLKSFEADLKKQNAQRTKKGLTPLAISWELNPNFDANDHTIEWAIRAKSTTAEAGSKPVRNEDTVNQTIGFLSRRGILDAIVVIPYRGFTDLVPLKQILKGLSFKEGERYADYQPTDKVSNLSLGDLIVKSAEPESKNSNTAQANAFGTSKPLKALWIMLPVLVGLGVVGIVVVVRQRSLRQSQVRNAPVEPITATAEAAPPACAAAPVRTNITAKPAKPMSKPAMAAKAAFRPGRSNGQEQADRRGKKVFDYNRYFTDLMSTVSHYSSGIEPISLNVAPLDAANSIEAEHEAHHVNGKENGRGPANGKVFEANADLIAQQTSFIEEQRRLMQEQSRLIEEKSRLIAEKNELLKLQNELIENKML